MALYLIWILISDYLEIYYIVKDSIFLGENIFAKAAKITSTAIIRLTDVYLTYVFIKIMSFYYKKTVQRFRESPDY